MKRECIPYIYNKVYILFFVTFTYVPDIPIYSFYTLLQVKRIKINKLYMILQHKDTHTKVNNPYLCKRLHRANHKLILISCSNLEH